MVNLVEQHRTRENSRMGKMNTAECGHCFNPCLCLGVLSDKD